MKSRVSKETRSFSGDRSCKTKPSFLASSVCKYEAALPLLRSLGKVLHRYSRTIGFVTKVLYPISTFHILPKLLYTHFFVSRSISKKKLWWCSGQAHTEPYSPLHFAPLLLMHSLKNQGGRCIKSKLRCLFLFCSMSFPFVVQIFGHWLIM